MSRRFSAHGGALLPAVLRCAGAAGLVIGAIHYAHAQSAAPPVDQGQGVIHPPVTIDPKMTVAPPKNVRLPTLVVRPSVPKGTVVVPK